MQNTRSHIRLTRPEVEVDSPLIDCRLVDLSSAGLGIETSIGLRLGVPYPFRLRDGDRVLSTEAVVRWCRLVRTEATGGDARPVFRVGAAFVDWQPQTAELPGPSFEDEVDDAVDGWIGRSRQAGAGQRAGRTIIRNSTPDPGSGG